MKIETPEETNQITLEEFFRNSLFLHIIVILISIIVLIFEIYL